MTKIFLSSYGIPEKLREEFWRFINIKPQDLKVAYIANASDNYKNRDWVYSTKNYFISLGVSVKDVDLRKYDKKQEKLIADLSLCHLIWVGAGDVFPLNMVMRSCSFKEVVCKLLKQGVIYCGESAGAIVAGPSLEHFAEGEKDDLETAGLGIVDFLPIPHWENPEYKDSFDTITSSLAQTNYRIIRIRDDQVVFCSERRCELKLSP